MTWVLGNTCYINGRKLEFGKGGQVTAMGHTLPSRSGVLNISLQLAAIQLQLVKKWEMGRCQVYTNDSLMVFAEFNKNYSASSTCSLSHF